MSCIVSNLLTAWESAEVAMLNKEARPLGNEVARHTLKATPIEWELH